MLAAPTLVVRGLLSPDVNGLLPSQDACADNATFVDVGGRSCAQWAAVQCDLATKDACGYSAAEFDAVLAKCPVTCNTCDVSVGIDVNPFSKSAGQRKMSSATLVHERGEGDGPAGEPGVVGATSPHATDVTAGATTCPFMGGPLPLSNLRRKSDDAAGDNFGHSVAIKGSTIVVGAWGDDVNGAASGSAYLFDRSGKQLAKMTASDGEAGDNFGMSVAISGATVVVGAWGDNDKGSASGSAYLFNKSGKQLAKLTASDGAYGDYFGHSVAISGSTVVVGAWGDDTVKGTNSGSAYLFDRSGKQLAKLTASDGNSGDNFGMSVAIANSTVVVGANGYAGSAYLFDKSGKQLAKLTASDGADGDNFGGSVAISGSTVVVGAWGDDSKGTNSGSAYLFDLSGKQLAKLTASDGASYDYFGMSVAISGSNVVVGANFDEDKGDDDMGAALGSAYLFDLSGNQISKLTASADAKDDYFGQSVDISGSTVVVGASALEDDDFFSTTLRRTVPRRTSGENWARSHWTRLHRSRRQGTASCVVYLFDVSGHELAKLAAVDGNATGNTSLVPRGLGNPVG